MTQEKIDPRVLRTRKSIMDAFIELSTKKEFKDITVKDITTEAMVNRATFYAHFEDIYDLLEKVLSEVFLINLDHRILAENTFNEETVVSIFTAITNFQRSLSSRCHRGYEDTIARIIRDQLDVIFNKLLAAKHAEKDDDIVKRTTTMLSWGIYGASVEWRKNSMHLSPEVFIKKAIPFIFTGVELSYVGGDGDV
ncbi:TetR/AcrR family transcriptional regulator [Lysinibacillus macroides]|uniref:TetR family transcriptional regulator n=1 Tax=Lysinibacillus macroides TaxID=33935 RepID=A0A0M9DHK1_9BACI|nr:TetR/AcrR family transcriptional regulator [Lysinibacillus macroides]KOY80566.1 TetR family transcriptional regulator [Lysinibacillus macroides]QPR69700.1 TetR/AcrR family transcriptional regulator [Lysinibacillus macroides]